MNPLSAILLAMLLLMAGAVISLLLSFNRRLAGWLSFGVTATASLLALWASLTTILYGPVKQPNPILSLWGSPLRFSLDGLGAIFLALIAIVSVLSALYSIGYMDHYKDYHVGRYYPWLLLFIAGMYGIVTVTDTMVFFCVFWQIMTIPSFALIRFEWRKPENVRAANKYLVIMEIACLLIMAGSAVLVYTGNVPKGIAGLPRFDFDTLRRQIQEQGTHPHALFPALALMTIGFGIKAGMWLFGLAWLPDAHPAAPAPVSALLSGVMIKTGVYGLIRTFFWLVPQPAARGFSPEFWGWGLAVIGTVTLVVGTYQALRQDQAKRLLAFSSIGQVGYIILGLGVSLVLLRGDANIRMLATIALVGALFHTINHAFFKSLLFLNAGTVMKATHTQDLNKLGGLMMLMPFTAVTCLIASFSIAGVPLFNGFASKWTISVATILGSKYAPPLALCGLLGILTSALTLALLMKFFGMMFLARRSTIVAQQVSAGVKLEAGPLMQVPQLVLAAGCVLLGLMPALGYIVLEKALASGPEGISRTEFLPPLDMHASSLATGLVAPSPLPQGEGAGMRVGGGAVYMPLVIAAVLALFMGLAHLISRLGSAPRRQADIWLCGYDAEADIHRYGARNLFGEVKNLFGRKP